MACQIGIGLTTLLLVQILGMKVGAQSSCPMALTSLSPCLTSGTGNSSTPSSLCCSELAKLVQTAPSCICETLSIGGAQAVGVILGRTLPSSLPGACNLEMPPMNDCNGLGLDPSNTQGDGSDGGYSSANLTKIPLPLAVSMTLLASYAILLS